MTHTLAPIHHLKSQLKGRRHSLKLCSTSKVGSLRTKIDSAY
jgi:hypothetical protein